MLYDTSLRATIAFCVALELAALPVFVAVGHRRRSRFGTAC